jgi:hypothetical protein
VVLAAAAGLKAAGPVGGVAEGVGGALMLIPGAEPAGAAVAGAGAAAKKVGKGRAADVARARQRRGEREEAQMRRQLGEPRENPNLEVRGGTVRQDRRQAAAQRSRQRRTAAAAAADEPPF